MNAPRSRFLLGFLLAALVIAGGLSSLSALEGSTEQEQFHAEAAAAA